MILYLVIPCYNEEAMLPITAKALESKMISLMECSKISPQSRILLVDDGSTDRTWELISNLHEGNPLFQGVKLTRNRGHQNALLAGLEYVRKQCDAAISMDADLQDDINAIDEMLVKYEEGFDIVYGVRSERASDSPFKRVTALGFYRLMNAMGVELTFNHADYRLMSKRALEGLSAFSEVNLFLRGMVPMIGYPSTSVFYVRSVRVAGESKYPLKKMLSFALEGITSLSVKPIRLILTLGLSMLALCVISLIALLIAWLCGGIETATPFLFLAIFFTCGLNLSAIGTVGEYIGKIYLETKHRPRYLIESTLPPNQTSASDSEA